MAVCQARVCLVTPVESVRCIAVDYVHLMLLCTLLATHTCGQHTAFGCTPLSGAGAKASLRAFFLEVLGLVMSQAADVGEGQQLLQLWSRQLVQMEITECRYECFHVLISPQPSPAVAAPPHTDATTTAAPLLTGECRQR
jgi:hypothetical protein